MAVPGTAAAGAATSSAAPPAYVGEQTAATLLRNTWRAYRRHLGVILACSVLPVLPFLLLMQWLAAIGSLWVLVPMMGYLVGIFLSSGALTLVVSDICLGNQPTLARAFSRILGKGRWWALLSTALLLTLFVYAGLILLIIPGLWLVVRGLFTSTIVMLEGQRNLAAIRRSMALTKGQGWRLTGLTLLPLLLLYVGLFAIAVVLAAGLLALLQDEELARHIVEALMSAVALGVVMPMLGIVIVLLYYDQRARRESYDARALSEDLMR